MPQTKKFSQFVDGGVVVDGDTIVGLRGGVNTKFLYTGTGPGTKGVTALHDGNAANVIPVWTGADWVITDSGITIDGTSLDTVDPTAVLTISGTTALGPPIGTTAERPGTPPNGATRYNTDIQNEEFFINGTWVPLNSGGGGNGEPVIMTITQPGNTLQPGQWVKIQGGLYVLAQADDAFDAEVVGFVLSIVTANTSFKLQQSGYVTGMPSTYVTGGVIAEDVVYFLDPAFPGQMTPTEPNVNGQVSRPVFVADSATSGWVLPYRGNIIGGGAPINPGTTIVTQAINQSAHGFVVGNIIAVTSTPNVYAKASATTMANAYLTAGVVTKVIDSNNFVMQQSGFVTPFVPDASLPIHVLVSGVCYFLDPANPGAFTNVEPTSPYASRPVFQTSSTNSIWIIPQRPITNATSSNAPVQNINQTGHGFQVGNVVRVTTTSGIYALAQSTTLANAYLTAGIVIAVIDANNFTLQQSGYLSGFVPTVGPTPSPGVTLFLSAATPGIMTATEPTGVGAITKPMFDPDETTSGWVLPQKPTVVASAGGGGDYVLITSIDPTGPGPFDFTNVFDGTYNNVRLVGTNLTFLATIPIAIYGTSYAQNFALQFYNGPTLNTSGLNYGYNTLNNVSATAFRDNMIIPGVVESGATFYSSLGGATLSFEMEMFGVATVGKMVNSTVGTQSFSGGSGGSSSNVNIFSGGMTWGCFLISGALLGVTGFRLYFSVAQAISITGGTIALYGIKN